MRSPRRASTALDAVNPKLNAVTFQIADQALRDDEAADAAVKAGDALGPLHGVPFSTKYNLDQKDLPTPNGVVAYKDIIAPADSPVAANWLKAGAVFIGLTNAPTLLTLIRVLSGSLLALPGTSTAKERCVCRPS